MDYKAWIELLLTAVIGATAIYVALKQYRLERKRDRRELWDRRKTVYDAVDEFLNALSQLGHPRTEDLNALARATKPTTLRVLFEPDIREYLDEVNAKAFEISVLWSATRQGGGKPESEERRLKLVEWMAQQRSSGLEKRFARYLPLPGRRRH
jgi:hypothetical protein